MRLRWCCARTPEPFLLWKRRHVEYYGLHLVVFLKSHVLLGGFGSTCRSRRVKVGPGDVQGTRTRDGRLGPSRKGVGRLVAACPQPPLGALPASHSNV